MPRRSRINWRKKDRQKVSNTVRQFNAKLTRTLKKHPELAPYLPDRLTVKGVTENIATRSDFNREINSLQRFLQSGAELPVNTQSGMQITRWEKREVGYKIGVINRRRTAERKKANVSTYKGTMGAIQEQNLNPKKYNVDKIKPSDWESFVKNVEKQVRSTYNDEKRERYKKNYIKGLENVFEGEADEIIEIVSNIDTDDFMQLFYDDPVLQIDFIYDPIELELRRDSIIEHLHAKGY